MPVKILRIMIKRKLWRLADKNPRTVSCKIESSRTQLFPPFSSPRMPLNVICCENKGVIDVNSVTERSTKGAETSSTTVETFRHLPTSTKLVWKTMVEDPENIRMSNMQ